MRSAIVLLSAKNSVLEADNVRLHANVEDLSRVIVDLTARDHAINLELKFRDMMHMGFACGEMPSRSFENLQQFLSSMRPKASGFITGKYEMKKLDVTSLRNGCERDLLPFHDLAKRFLCSRFSDVDIVLDDAAILHNPPTTQGRGECAQIYHADDISATGVTFIISLSDNCLSTHCLPIKFYGPEYPSDISYNDWISCNVLSNSRIHSRSNQVKMRKAVAARYHQVSNLSPAQFFEMSEGGKVVPAGSYTAFRDDLLHAGPAGNEGRWVLFLHYRVKSNQSSAYTNIQYRFDTLMEVCGFSPLERQVKHDEWLAAGHWSPYGPA
jgi:hypothetical protein